MGEAFPFLRGCNGSETRHICNACNALMLLVYVVCNVSGLLGMDTSLNTSVVYLYGVVYDADECARRDTTRNAESA